MPLDRGASTHKRGLTLLSSLHLRICGSMLQLMRTYQNFIGGEWVSAATGKTYANVNPADTREKVAEYPRAEAKRHGRRSRRRRTLFRRGAA